MHHKKTYQIICNISFRADVGTLLYQEQHFNSSKSAQVQQAISILGYSLSPLVPKASKDMNEHILSQATIVC